MQETRDPKPDDQGAEGETPPRSAHPGSSSPSPETPSARDGGSRAWRIYLALGVLTVWVYLLLPYPTVRDLVLHPAIGLSAVVAIVIGARVHHPARPPAWQLFATGLLMFVVADATFSYYEYVLALKPFPSLADVFYLGGYLPLAAGVLILTRGRISLGATGPASWTPRSSPPVWGCCRGSF